MRAQRNGFTLVELITVIAILGVVTALTLGATHRASALRNRAESASQMRQWGVALNGYMGDNDGALPRRGQGVQPLALLTRPEDWFNALPPYFGQKGYGDLVAAGQRPRAGQHSVFVRPGAKDPGGVAFLSYGMNMNLSAWNLANPTRLSEIEFPQLTVFLAESSGAYASTYPSTQAFSCVAPHSGKGNVLFLDGHVDAFDGTYLGVGTGDPGRNDVRWLTGTPSDAQAPMYK